MIIIIGEARRPRLPVPLRGGLGKQASSLFLRLPMIIP